MLISCPECNTKVSDKAHVCPHCGFRIDTLVKCPDCGKLVLPGTATCPECGYPLPGAPEITASHRGSQSGDLSTATSPGSTTPGALSRADVITDAPPSPTASSPAGESASESAAVEPAASGHVARRGESRGIDRAWYYEVHSFVHGPVSVDDILGKIQGGQLPPQVSVWGPGSSRWLPATDIVLFGEDSPDEADVAWRSSLPESKGLPPMVSTDGKTTFTYHVDHDEVMAARTATDETVETGQPSPGVGGDSGLGQSREDAGERSWLDPPLAMILGLLAGTVGDYVVKTIAGYEANWVFKFMFIVMTPGITFLAAWILTLPWLLIGRRPNRGSVLLTQMRIWVPLGVALLVVNAVGALSAQNRWANGIGAILFIVLGWIDRTVRSRRTRNLREAGLWAAYALQYWLLS